MKNKYASTRLSCYIGCFVQAVVCNLAPILFVTFQDRFTITNTQIGALVFINMTTQLMVDIISMRLVDRFGYRKTVLLSHLCAAAGLVMMAVLPNLLPMPYLCLIVSTVVYAAGSGMIEVVISPIVAALPTESSSAEFNFLHSFYCWGQVGTVVLSSVLLRVLGGDMWHVIPLIWAVVPVCNFFAFLRVPMVEQKVAKCKQMSVSQLLRSKQFVLILVVMTCAGAAEMAMSQWASLFAERSLQVDKLTGDLLGPCLFAVLMGSGRILYGFFGKRFNMNNLLIWSSVLCCLSYLTAALAPIPIVSLLGCALCGLSVSVMWPGVLGVAADKFVLGGTAMFGLLAMFGDIGCASGPALVGVISDLTGGANLPLSGLQIGLLCGIIFPLVMLIMLLTERKK